MSPAACCLGWLRKLNWLQLEDVAKDVETTKEDLSKLATLLGEQKPTLEKLIAALMTRLAALEKEHAVLKQTQAVTDEKLARVAEENTMLKSKLDGMDA